jgi:hypothetical protein|tara:strand:- start:44 stop:529 length:486 start_codon:yes stop_codon:yes gene_type:complete
MALNLLDNAQSSISASILWEEIKTSMVGILNYAPKDVYDKWVFAEVNVSNSSSDLLDTSDSYLGSATAVATGDKIHWICIKVVSTTSTDGVGIVLDAGTAAYNVGDGIFIGADEMVILKPANTTVADLHAIAVTMDGDYGYPSGTHGANVLVQVAAILDDV